MHSNLEQETMVRIRHSAIWSLLYISLYGVLTIIERNDYAKVRKVQTALKLRLRC